MSAFPLFSLHGEERYPLRADFCEITYLLPFVACVFKHYTFFTTNMFIPRKLAYAFARLIFVYDGEKKALTEILWVLNTYKSLFG
jgi:hypothetical protein